MWFVCEYGDKFIKFVFFWFEFFMKEWFVNIIVFCSVVYRLLEVKFGCGWREFSVVNGFEVGDLVKFFFWVMFKFDVCVIFSEFGNLIL